MICTCRGRIGGMVSQRGFRCCLDWGFRERLCLCRARDSGVARFRGGDILWEGMNVDVRCYFTIFWLHDFGVMGWVGIRFPDFWVFQIWV